MIFFLQCPRDLTDLPSFPTRRSSDLIGLFPPDRRIGALGEVLAPAPGHGLAPRSDLLWNRRIGPGEPDRKSTRLNSSHVEISYAVFCLKKKKQQIWSGWIARRDSRLA